MASMLPASLRAGTTTDTDMSFERVVAPAIGLAINTLTKHRAETIGRGAKYRLMT
ncbi:MAG: hypothetical protein ABJA83_00175 [Burkholderiaceae bacterium]